MNLISTILWLRGNVLATMVFWSTLRIVTQFGVLIRLLLQRVLCSFTVGAKRPTEKDFRWLKKRFCVFLSNLFLVRVKKVVQCWFCFIGKKLQIGFAATRTRIWTAVTGNRRHSWKVTLKAFPMFEMWSAVTSKLEANQQQQQPHTSSGSIKGALRFFFTRRNCFCCLKM